MSQGPAEQQLRTLQLPPVTLDAVQRRMVWDCLSCTVEEEYCAVDRLHPRIHTTMLSVFCHPLCTWMCYIFSNPVRCVWGERAHPGCIHCIRSCVRCA